jgi:hypothetical protein
LEHEVLHADETTLQVLKKTGKTARSKPQYYGQCRFGETILIYRF